MRIVVNIDQSAIREPRAIALIARGILLGVVMANVFIMRRARAEGRPLPRLYESGVRFEPEPNQGIWEDFADCLTVLSRNWGDCDDLVAYRCAELIETGEDPKARVKIYWRKQTKPDGTKTNVYHAEVRRSNVSRFGPAEDPSRFLGM